MPPDQDTLIETERIRSVFQQAPVTLLVAVINAVLTALVLAPVSNQPALLTWVALIIAASCTRLVIRQRFLAQAFHGTGHRRWAALSIAGSLVMGALWGLGATVLPPAIQTYQLFFAFVVGGMCAGTTVVNSAHLPTVLAFILPASLPLAVSLLAEGSPPQFEAALMIFVFASALCLTTWRAHGTFGQQIKLQLALSDANERLRGEIVERQKAEATLHQAQKMEAIGLLTGGIAHDFNNLLHVVTGNLSMIGRLSNQDSPVLKYVQAAEQAARQGGQLTNSLLAFARRQFLQARRVNLNAVLQEFQPLLLQAAGNKVQFQFGLAPGLPDCNADPAHFQSAILNLVINARDAMPAGGHLSITTDLAILGKNDLLMNPDASPGSFVSVMVQDNGSGMTAEVMAQVFEPFFTTKEVGKGSGLGLSQVYGFARQSHGHVYLRSTPEAGTCVTLYLPAVIPA